MEKNPRKTDATNAEYSFLNIFRKSLQIYSDSYKFELKRFCRTAKIQTPV